MKNTTKRILKTHPKEKKSVIKKVEKAITNNRVKVSIKEIVQILDDKMKKEKPAPQIVSNRIKTPDGTILISRNRHDFVQHIDTITGGSFAVDGGHDYLRRAFSGRYEEMSTYTNSNFELIRYTMEWGTYGIKGDQPLQYRTLAHMSNSHIAAIIKTQTHIPSWAKKIFEKELKYRAKKNIVIEDRKFESELKQEHDAVVKDNLTPKTKAKKK